MFIPWKLILQGTPVLRWTDTFQPFCSQQFVANIEGVTCSETKCKYGSSSWFQVPLLLQAANNLCHPHNPQDARNAQSTNIPSIHRERHDHINDRRESDEEVECIPSGTAHVMLVSQ